MKNVTPRLDRHDFDLTLRTPRRTYRFRADELGSHLDQATLSRVLGRRRNPSKPWLLLAPYVSPEMAERLIQGGVSFVDRAGNCHLDLGGNYVAHVVGRRPQAEPGSGGLRAPAYRVLFVLLADPALTAAPLRKIAALAGVSLGTVVSVMKRLRADRFVVGSRSKSQLVGAAALVDRWVAAYADLLRPKLLIGRYAPGARGSKALEERIERALADRWPWAYGGTAAGQRLTGHYRGDETVVHVSAAAKRHVMRQLEATPSREGSLVLVAPPVPLALDGPQPHVAHPLLVYAEMLCATSPRAAEAARDVRERFLKLP